MLRISVAERARGFVDQLPPKHQRQISAKISSLRADPHPPDSKELKGYSLRLRRVTSGEYRIIYHVDGDMLVVEVVGKRNDDEVYRQLRRMQ